MDQHIDETNNTEANNIESNNTESNIQTNKKKNAIEALKFLLFSISAGLIQIGSYTLMLEVFNFNAWVAELISLVLSVIWNFTFNRKFTFHSASNVKIAMLKVAAYYVVFAPLSYWWTQRLVKDALWNEYLVLGITMIINFVTEFLYQKFFVFKK